MDSPNSTGSKNEPRVPTAHDHATSAGRTSNEKQDQPTKNHKRNACALCRKRKMRCDGGTPSCGTCTRLNHECSYTDRRRQSGPRRGYVKGLENRLAQVEELLKQKDEADPSMDSSPTLSRGNTSSLGLNEGHSVSFIMPDISMGEFEPDQNTSGCPQAPLPLQGDDLFDLGGLDGVSWAMIELGVDEPLPAQDAIDELTSIYFAKVHPTTPIIHERRFHNAMNLSPYARPSVALRYAMWTLAASITDKYKDLHFHFHSRARKYAEADERAGRHKFINVRHAQAWLLIAIYEFKMMHFPTAWLTTGRATRLVQMLSLTTLDGPARDAKQTLPPSASFGEKEERRRTFWMSFCIDRYSSVGTGWPFIIDERDILTNLPSSDEAFAQDEDVTSMSLTEAMNDPLSAASLSSFAGTAVISSLTGRLLVHLQRPAPDNDDSNLNGQFWKNHRKMDNILLNTSLYLPSHLRLPAGSSNANTIFMNMSLHATVICLHQAAISKVEKLELSGSIVAESRTRCVAAATEITNIMKIIAHMDLSLLNVYTPFSLYVAARIFGHISKSSPEDDNARYSVRFLLSALIAMKEVIPLSDSYLMQLELEGIGLSFLQENVRPYSSLEKLAEMTLNDSLAESSWNTFVSPMVSKVSDGSPLAPGTSPENQSESRKSSKSPNTQKLSAGDTTSSSSDRSRENNPRSIHPEELTTPQMLDTFIITENWDAEDTTLPLDIFDGYAQGISADRTRNVPSDLRAPGLGSSQSQAEELTTTQMTESFIVTETWDAEDTTLPLDIFDGYGSY